MPVASTRSNASSQVLATGVEVLVSGVLVETEDDGADTALVVLSVLVVLVVLSFMRPPSLCRRDAAKLYFVGR